MDFKSKLFQLEPHEMLFKIRGTHNLYMLNIKKFPLFSLLKFKNPKQ